MILFQNVKSCGRKRLGHQIPVPNREAVHKVQRRLKFVTNNQFPKLNGLGIVKQTSISTDAMAVFQNLQTLLQQKISCGVHIDKIFTRISLGTLFIDPFLFVSFPEFGSSAAQNGS